MKKTRLMSIALLMMALLATIGCSNEPKIKTVLNPTNAEDSTAVDAGDLYTDKLDKVILTDSMTIMDFSFTPEEWMEEKGGYCLSISPKTYIVANGQKYYLIGTKDIPIGELVQSEEIHYRTATYTLIFPPIPFDTESISFYEEGDGYTAKLRGIDLTGNASTIAYKDKKDSEVYAAKMKSFMEEKEAAENYREEQASKKYYCKLCGKAFNSLEALVNDLMCLKNPHLNGAGFTEYGKHEPY